MSSHICICVHMPRPECEDQHRACGNWLSLSTIVWTQVMDLATSTLPTEPFHWLAMPITTEGQLSLRRVLLLVSHLIPRFSSFFLSFIHLTKLLFWNVLEVSTDIRSHTFLGATWHISESTPILLTCLPSWMFISSWGWEYPVQFSSLCIAYSHPTEPLFSIFLLVENFIWCILMIPSPPHRSSQVHILVLTHSNLCPLFPSIPPSLLSSPTQYTIWCVAMRWSVLDHQKSHL